jgi:hypothetical protein
MIIKAATTHPATKFYIMAATPGKLCWLADQKHKIHRATLSQVAAQDRRRVLRAHTAG